MLIDDIGNAILDPDVLSLRAARWGKHDEPQAYSPEEALEALLRDIRSGKVKATHLIIAVAHDVGDAEQTQYYQAGQFGYHAQVGLVECVGHMMKRRA